VKKGPQKDLLDSLFASVRHEARRRKANHEWTNKAEALRRVLRPHQRRLEGDPSPRIAVRSARQVGKSTAAMLIACIRCLEHAQSDWVVVGLTRPSVKRIYWSALQKLNDKDKGFDLGLKFQFQELTATFPNGSRIFFVGGDNWAEIEKLRGGRYHGAIIDECKSFPLAIFEALLQDVLEPALMGQAGQLYLIGTPGDQLVGEFYLATCEPPVLRGERWSNKPFGVDEWVSKAALWSFHRWTLRDNDVKFVDPRTGLEFTLWDKALKIKADRGWADDHPTWRREYLGEWVATDGRLVYRYRPHVHDYTPLADTRWGLPEKAHAAGLKTVVGFDFGTRDGTAIVVWAYSLTSPDLWEVYSEKRKALPGQKLTVGDIAAWYKEVEAEYGPFEGWPADWAGLATMVMDTLGDEHGVYLEPAEKKQKNDFIEMFNSDLDAGYIHIRRGSELAKEMLAHRWADKHLLRVKDEHGERDVLNTEKRREDDSTPNDLCDAGLYSFRWSRHRSHRPAPSPGFAMYSTSWWQQLAAEELKRAEDAARAARAPAELDAPWWNP
jgi:hypothetical protein